MSQRTTTFQTTNAVIGWKLLWRLDAAGNLIAGDIMLFAAGQIIDWMGMALIADILLERERLLTTA